MSFAGLSAYRPLWAKSRLNHFLFALAIGLVVVANLSWRSTGQGYGALTSANLALVIAAVATHLAGHVLRAEKMVLLLKPLHPRCRYPVYRCLGIGYLFNFLLPFRMGELIRAHLLGTELGISRTATFLAIVFERIIDAAMLGAALVVIVIATHELRLLSLSISMLASAALLTVGLAYIVRPGRWVLKTVLLLSGMLNDRLRDKARYSAWSAIRFLQLLRGSGHWTKYILLSFLMWIFYIAAVMLLLEALVPGLDRRLAAIFSTDAYVATSMSAAPASVGEFVAGFILLAKPLLRLPDAGVDIRLIWALLMVPTSALGLLFLLIHPRMPRARQGNIPAEIEKLMRQGTMHDDFGEFLDSYFRRSLLVHELDGMEARGASRNVRILSGGSMALTVLVDVGGTMRVRKLAMRHHAPKLQAQVDWLRKFEEHDFFPHILTVDESGGAVAIDMPFYGSHQSFFEFIHRSDVDRSVDRLSAILCAMRATIYADAVPVSRPAALRNYMAVKIEKKVADASAMSGVLAELAALDELTINGKRCRGLGPVLAAIRANDEMMSDLSRFEEGDIHGDLTVDNILVREGDGDFVILDPNNENDINDQVVDIAKLWQSLHSGYEFLRDVDTVEVDGASIRFSECRSHQYEQIHARLSEIAQRDLPLHRIRSILFHEAVHYCRMLTYRVVINPQTAPLFFAIAVRLFNEYVDQYDVGR